MMNLTNLLKTVTSKKKLLSMFFVLYGLNANATSFGEYMGYAQTYISAGASALATGIGQQSTANSLASVGLTWLSNQYQAQANASFSQASTYGQVATFLGNEAKDIGTWDGSYNEQQQGQGAIDAGAAISSTADNYRSSGGGCKNGDTTCTSMSNY